MSAKDIKAEAVARALRAKKASVPLANPVQPRKGMKAPRGMADMVTPDDLRNTLKKAMK